MKHRQQFQDELRIFDDSSEETFDEIVSEEVEEDWNASTEAVRRWRANKKNREKELVAMQGRSHYTVFVFFKLCF